jgi:fructokinase
LKNDQRILKTKIFISVGRFSIRWTFVFKAFWVPATEEPFGARPARAFGSPKKTLEMIMQPRILSIGEILFDVYPNEKRLGGAPLNFAYHLHQLGCDIAFVSRIGADGDGDAIFEQLRRRDFPTTHLQRDDLHPTGAVRVKLNENALPEFAIVTPAAYDFIAWNDELKRLCNSNLDLIYFGTLAQRRPLSRHTIQTILAAAPASTLCFYDMNLRQAFYTPEILADSLSTCDAVKLNENELETVKKIFKLPANDHHAVQDLMAEFKIKLLCLTRGEKGSSIFTKGGKIQWDANSTAPLSVIDTVGAGDSYAAILAYGLLAKWPLPEIIQRASRFAAAICTIPGAVPEDSSFYRQHTI